MGVGAETYDAVARELAAGLRVVRLRRRRYVQDADVTCDMHREAHDVLAVCNALGSPVHLFGHSSGAVVALEAACADPSRFIEVIAYEPPIPTSDLVAGEAGARAHRALDDGDPIESMRIHLRDIAQVDASFLDDLADDEATRNALSEVVAAQLADNDALDDLSVGIGRYADLALPVFFPQGENSPRHLRRRTAELVDVLPSASVVDLPGQGHVANVADPANLARTSGRIIRTTGQ